MQPLVKAGKVYIAQPPLYRVVIGKKEYYAFDDQELSRVMKDLGDSRARAEIKRFKGLGEMVAEQLWDTTMNPENRTILKVSLEDAVEADEIFTILMGNKVEPRRQFIFEHAAEVQNLDI